MDYKKVFKSEKTRQTILNLLSFVPDKIMLKIQYRIKTGRKLNLKNPQRFTEKLQWYKLNYRDDTMIQCSDKADVREYVKSCGCEEILNECYGVFDSPEAIDFDALPEQFVAKDTLGSGGRSVIIVTDKHKVDWQALKEQMQQWIQEPCHVKPGGREWPYYSGKPHRIIIEKLLERDANGDLPDYKFFCFNGEVYCLYTMINYFADHSQGQLGFYDTSFSKLPFCREDFKDIEVELQKPQNFEKMLEYARCLSKGFPHARIDFYNINGKIIFGEITFFNASGYIMFRQDEGDFEMGKHFILPECKRK